VRIDGDSASISGLVSTDVWEHIEREDVFGAAHRRRAGELTGSGDVKIEITGAVAAMQPGSGPFARDWVIVNAARRVDDAPGEVWTGALFSNPPQWSKAGDALVELGFSAVSNGDISAGYTDSTGTTVTISANPDARLGSITCRRVIGPADSSSLVDVLVVVNHVNDTFPAGTLTFAGDTLTMKCGVPIPEGNDVSDVLEALAYGLPGMLEMVAPAIRRVASGDITSTDAIHEIFG
jgi:hypothetical protein